MFCDWHLELAKPVLQGGADGAGQSRDAGDDRPCARHVYALLHPFMPFVTEELWAIKGEDGPPRGAARARSLAQAGLEVDQAVEAEIGWIVDLVSEIRSVRSEMGVPPSTQTPLMLVAPSEAAAEDRDRLERDHQAARAHRADRIGEDRAGRLAADRRARTIWSRCRSRASSTSRRKSPPRQGNRKERQEIAKVDAKLGNADFVARAPEEIIAEHTSGARRFSNGSAS